MLAAMARLQTSMPAKPLRAVKPSARTPSKTPARARPVLRFRMRITAGDAIAVGPGRIALLEAIENTGSITAAAKSLDMSYRRAWVLLDELNRSLRLPAVDSAKGGQLGGGSALTDVGRRLIELYRRIEKTAASACHGDIQQLMKLLAR
jgi:molybdate transport system regulatory protein